MKKRVRFLELFALCVGLTVLSGCGSSNNSMAAPPAPDFSLNLSPQSLFVPIGVGSSSLQVSVQAFNGFNQAVSVSVTGLPTGVTTNPSSPFSVNAGNSQTVVFSATTGLQPGVQQVSFQGTSGALSHGSAISLSVANPVYAYLANGAPQLPPNNITGIRGGRQHGCGMGAARAASQLAQPSHRHRGCFRNRRGLRFRSHVG